MSALIEAKKAGFNYDILETSEAGIELRGFEVKSLRAGHGSLEGAYVRMEGNEAKLVGATIPPYQVGNTPAGYDPSRPRRLLLTKPELKRLVGQIKEKGLTVIPLSIYNKNGRLKLGIALVRGKKKYDKRETIKKREAERHMERSLRE